jgi:uncharacterized protein YecE (DUF72 family)
MGAVRFGTAGWDYRDWWGTVYPVPRPRGFEPLGYLAEFFDVVEINSSFYRPPAASSAVSWAKRVAHNPRFTFTAKLWRRFTHERDRSWGTQEVEQVTAGLAPLMERDALGCLLVQFPWSFKRQPATEEWLDDILRAFSAFPVSVEVRHASWNSAEFYGALAERGVGVVNIDQPLFGKSIAPGERVTSGVGYVRLHGRNYQNWFRDDAEPHERYDYLYSAAELGGWLDRIHGIAAHARETYVVTNNHYLGQAASNAAMLRALYGGSVAEVPPALYEKYRDVLSPLGIRPRAPQQPDLG